MKAWRWIAFGGLCSWHASGWLLPAPATAVSAPGLLGFTCLLTALFAGAVIRRQRGDGVAWRSVAIASVLMVAAPVLLLQQVSAYAPDTNVTIMFTLLPVVVVLVWGAAQNGQSGMAALLPALVGASGVLLILPFEQPESLRGWLAMGEALVAMLLTGLGGVWLHRCLRGEHILRALAVAGSANATVLLIWSLVRGERLWLGWDLRNIAVALVGAIAFAVTLWLAKAIDPVRFSTRYLLIPLVTIVEGMILLRPPLTGRLIGGVSLLLMGTIWLQSRDERVDEKVLSLK